jgi:hypothetical protein
MRYLHLHSARYGLPSLPENGLPRYWICAVPFLLAFLRSLLFSFNFFRHYNAHKFAILKILPSPHRLSGTLVLAGN